MSTGRQSGHTNSGPKASRSFCDCFCELSCDEKRPALQLAAATWQRASANVPGSPRVSLADRDTQSARRSRSLLRLPPLGTSFRARIFPRRTDSWSFARASPSVALQGAWACHHSEALETPGPLSKHSVLRVPSQRRLRSRVCHIYPEAT